MGTAAKRSPQNSLQTCPALYPAGPLPTKRRSASRPTPKSRPLIVKLAILQEAQAFAFSIHTAGSISGEWGCVVEEFSSVFEGVTDPRRSNATRHSLHEMLMIALLSTLCGGEGCADMERFGRAKEGFLRRFMVLKHGIPSHDAFSDLFNALDPGGLQTVLLRLLEDWAAVLDGDVIAIDGKSLRRSFADAAARSPVHLVQAFAAGARLMLGQVKVDDKSNEIAAMPKLLEMLALKGRIVTADAMHTQRRTFRC